MNDLPSYDAHQIMEEVRRMRNDSPRVSVYRFDEAPLSQAELVTIDRRLNKAYQDIRSRLPDVQRNEMLNIAGVFWYLEGVYTWTPTIFYHSDEGDQLRFDVTDYNTVSVQNANDELKDFTTSNTLRTPLTRSTTEVMESLQKLAVYSERSDIPYGVYITGDHDEKHGILVSHLPGHVHWGQER